MDNNIKAEIICDSIFQTRITTYLLTYPRFIHAEMLRHRMLSRSAQSSRAVPVEKILQKVKENPVIPIHWGKKQKGMQAFDELNETEQCNAKAIWLEGRDKAVKIAEDLLSSGLHKQIVNRVLEPYCTITEVVTGTDWGNFFNLRVSKEAEPHIRKLATDMLKLYISNKPEKLSVGEWHLPFILPEEYVFDYPKLIKISFARCARASYVNFYGKKNIEDDIRLHNELVEKYHLSPAEHLAVCFKLYNGKSHYNKNFRGWKSYRSSIPNENRMEFDAEKLLKEVENL